MVYVEISLSGSGEGLGRAIVRGYSTIRGEVGNLNSIKFLRVSFHPFPKLTPLNASADSRRRPGFGIARGRIFGKFEFLPLIKLSHSYNSLVFQINYDSRSESRSGPRG